MTHPPDRLTEPFAPATTRQWQDGWWLEARRVPSPNFGARPVGAFVDLIVLHSISLPPGRYGGDEVLQLFCNALDCGAHPYLERLRGVQVSSHFFLRRGGALIQCVSCDDRAWHAGASRYRGRDNCNDDSIGIELEGLEGDLFEPAQYEVLARLCKAVATQYPIGHVAGHEHVAPARKFDPGPGFDWERLGRALAWDGTCFPG
ncbi:MAG: 1,6-anhydro-N-acetylmuramyl-L-alanine amidase AmpD [Burkholderiales bacterium]